MGKGSNSHVARVILETTGEEGLWGGEFVVHVNGRQYTPTEVVAALRAVQRKGGWQKAYMQAEALCIELRMAIADMEHGLRQARKALKTHEQGQ